MNHPTKGIQITVRSSGLNDAEERALAVLAANGIKVFGSRSYGPIIERVLLIVVDDGPKSHLVLEAAGFDCQHLTEVVLVPLQGVVPKFELIAQLTRAGVGVLYSYSFLPHENKSYVVLKTRDDDHALRVIESSQMRSAA